jgi:HK97 family phage prohead protease
MSRQHYDFAGWATKNDIRCSDGRTIRHGAFSADDGKRVPLVWMHNHKDVNQVLGHADLEEREDGVYAYCSFNNTDAGQNAKECVEHGDVVALSIFANELRQKGGDVIHGAIKEVSVVLAGANRGALIDAVLSHGEVSEEEAQISFVGYGDIILHKDKDDDEDEDEDEKEDMTDEGEEDDESDEEPEEEEDEEEDEKAVKHADDEGDETVGDVLATLNEKQKKAVAILISQAVSGKKTDKALSHAEDEGETSDEGETVEDVYNTFNEKQKEVVAFLVGKAAEEAEGGSEMKHNAFDGSTVQNTLSHDDFMEIVKVGKQMGSLREAFRQAEEEGFLAHADGDAPVAGVDYGIGNIDYLFPDAKTINTTPDFIKREQDWVAKVLGATHHTPFSRVKSIFADITEDAARAKGYIKGKLKKEEVFGLLKRSTDPQTIYKKQKLDKDDIEDITDFNVVAWLKAEMQMMLKEEIARAILIGDGRLQSDDDKIQESHIRPVYNDADLYTVKIPVEVAANATDDDIAKALIRAMVKARKQYKGSGNPSFFTTDDYVTDALLLENGINERLYKSEAEVATAMRVKEIVPVEVMEGQTIAITENNVTTTYPLIGVEVNLADYNVGTNGGAKTDFFDDFDIDYNQYKYLYETRMSGALIKPFSAISFYLKRAQAAGNNEEPQG